MEATARQAIGVESCGPQSWIEQELAASKLPDARLEEALQQLVEQMAAAWGVAFPGLSGLAATKTAYRFFSNRRIREEQILAGHFEATRSRLPLAEVPIWFCTTPPSSVTSARYGRSGLVSKGSVRKDEQGRQVYFTTCGINLTSVWP